MTSEAKLHRVRTDKLSDAKIFINRLIRSLFRNPESSGITGDKRAMQEKNFLPN